MIYTYDTADNNRVNYVSEAPNEYNNPSLVDVESDEEALSIWKQTENGMMFVRDNSIVVVNADNEVVFTKDLI